jgi:L-2-hydroxyglutarate oxidase
VNADYVVVGGGVIGVRVATELARAGARRVVLLEKESRAGMHASGRNSGVLHAGFYYSADSQKARFCRDGNRAMRQYIAEHGLPLNDCGKLVVARGPGELDMLRTLEKRGIANAVPVELISEEAAREIEPRAKTHQLALWSPSTATCDPVAVMESFVVEAAAAGVDIRTNERYIGRTPDGLRTSGGTVSCGHVVNCAGLYADRIARDFGFSESFVILPFKGLYLYSSERAGAFRTNIYPVPSAANPFLGVHFTITADGHAKIGPTAIPCLSREQYGLLDGLNAREFREIAGWTSRLLARSPFGFRRLALEEVKKFRRARLVELAAELATGVEQKHYQRFGKPGIRAQLLDTRTRNLVMDFMIEGDDRSTHVLNAVSPAWTCSIPFAEHVARLALGVRNAGVAS